MSISGKLCSSDRSCLYGDSVNILTCLYYYLKEVYCYVSRKDTAGKAKDKQSCRIRIDLTKRLCKTRTMDDAAGEDEGY